MAIEVRRQQRVELLAQRVDAGWDGRHERSTAHGALAPSRAWPWCLPLAFSHAIHGSYAYWRRLLASIHRPAGTLSGGLVEAADVVLGRVGVAGLPGFSTEGPRSSGRDVDGQVGWACAGSTRW